MNVPPLAFAFNPIIVTVDGTNGNTVTVTSSGISLQREVRSGKATFDLQAIARTLFDPKQFYDVKSNDVNLIKNLSVEYGGETQNIPVIWGALQIGETWTQTKTLTWFKNFPFTVPLYLSAAKTLRRRYDKTVYTNYLNLEEGKYNILVGSDIDPKDKVVFRIDGDREGGIFDYRYDYQFRGISKNTILITLLVNECTGGTYLRWINRHGEYCYYLFDRGTAANETKNTGIDIAQYLTTVDYTGGYHPGTSHPQAKQAQQTVKLFAPLVDRDTHAFLQTLLESPFVNLFNGYGDDSKPRWTGVNIAPATTAYDSTPLQDFECTLILPETFTQSL
jgi:hypothetical protein